MLWAEPAMLICECLVITAIQNLDLSTKISLNLCRMNTGLDASKTKSRKNYFYILRKSVIIVSRYTDKWKKIFPGWHDQHAKRNHP